MQLEEQSKRAYRLPHDRDDMLFLMIALYSDEEIDFIA